MSRIHEALKRAELERAHGRAAAAGIASADPPEVAIAAPQTIESPIEKQPAGSVRMDVPWTFEALLARRQPFAAWKPDATTDVFNGGQQNHCAEQFRTLRSRLYHIRNHHPLKTLLVTSSMAAEGKTFVTGNLVRSIILQPERRVLVIDADLRRPRLHAVFGSPTVPGLTDYLRGTSDETSIIQYGESGNLCLITSGTRVKDSSDLLSNGRMKTLLERLSPAFDWVIIDSPPCLPVADAGVVSQWCDGVLLVVRANYSPSAVIAKSRQELKGRNLVGVVLNAVEGNGSHYGSYYGGSGDSEN